MCVAAVPSHWVRSVENRRKTWPALQACTRAGGRPTTADASTRRRRLAALAGLRRQVRADRRIAPGAGAPVTDGRRRRARGGVNAALLYFIKAFVGPGCLSLPLAFQNAGLELGLVTLLTLAIGVTRSIYAP